MNGTRTLLGWGVKDCLGVVGGGYVAGREGVGVRGCAGFGLEAAGGCCATGGPAVGGDAD